MINENIKRDINGDLEYINNLNMKESNIIVMNVSISQNLGLILEYYTCCRDIKMVYIYIYVIVMLYVTSWDGGVLEYIMLLLYNVSPV